MKVERKEIMSLRDLENAILAGAKTVLNNPKLKRKDIMEWSTGDIKPHDGEVVIYIPDPGVNISVMKEHDKRK
jgi:hypothetical protein